jgi:hypothetical protein
MNLASEIISEECSVLAFYGIGEREDQKAYFFDTMTQWFEKLGYPPNRLSIRGLGHSGKAISFTRGAANLRKTGFKEISTIGMYSMPPKWDFLINDCLLYASYNNDTRYDGRSKFSDMTVAARSSIASLAHDSLLPIAQTLVEELKPDYGIGYKGLKSKAPSLYAIGLNYGAGASSGPEYEESVNIGRWSDGMEQHVYRGGILRDVYPWNFLNRKQLDMNVGDISLEQWIQQDDNRGSLNPISKDLHLWEVQDANIPALKIELCNVDLIFDWKKHLKQA